MDICSFFLLDRAGKACYPEFNRRIKSSQSGEKERNESRWIRYAYFFACKT